MPAPRARPRLVRVNELPYTRVVLDVQLGREPLHGRLRLAGHPEVSFDGWLELMSALDRLATAPEHRTFRAAPQED